MVMRLFVADLILTLALIFAFLGWIGASFGPLPTYIAWGLAVGGFVLWPSKRRAVFVAGVVTFIVWAGMAILVALAAAEVRDRLLARRPTEGAR